MGRLTRGLPGLRSGELPRRLARIVSPDAVFPFLPELDLPADEPFDWATVPLDDAGRLQGFFRDGSVETHIHLGGSLPPLFYWLPFMGGDLPWTCVSHLLSEARGDAGAAVWQRKTARAAWLRLWLAARLDRAGGDGIALFPWLPAEGLAAFLDRESPANLDELRELVCAVSRRRTSRQAIADSDWPFADPLRPPPRDGRRPHFAAGERRLLYAAARALAVPHEARFEVRLREYLGVSHAFHRLLCHDRGPFGLLRFGEKYDVRGRWVRSAMRRPIRSESRRGDRARRGGRRQRQLRRHTMWFARAAMSAALDGQLSEPFFDARREVDYRSVEGCAPEGAANLAATGGAATERGIEVRVLVPRLRDLPHALTAWLAGIADHVRQTDQSEFRSRVGLVFHFSKKGQLERDAVEAEAAAERLYWALATHPVARAFVVGIDAAGMERRSTPRTFGRAFSYLRARCERFRPSPGQPTMRLGYTFHVGEDVDDFLTGLRHIDEVTMLLLPGGEEGGRLGHALVLGEPPARFYRRRGITEPPLGRHLLDLVWAWGRLGGEAEGEAEREWIARRIEALCVGARGRDSVVHWQQQIARCFDAMAIAMAPNEPRHLLEDELVGLLVVGHGDLSAAVTDSLQDHQPSPVEEPLWIPMLERLQEWLRRRIAQMRITVEANPSSNLLVGGYESYADLPYWPIIEAGIPMSLNTDDPGLFMTTLPGEYRAMYEALLGGGVNHAEVLDWLDQRRIHARQSTFLHAGVPAGGRAAALAGRALAPGSQSLLNSAGK